MLSGGRVWPVTSSLGCLILVYYNRLKPRESFGNVNDVRGPQAERNMLFTVFQDLLEVKHMVLGAVSFLPDYSDLLQIGFGVVNPGFEDRFQRCQRMI